MDDEIFIKMSVRIDEEHLPKSEVNKECRESNMYQAQAFACLSTNAACENMFALADVN